MSPAKRHYPPAYHRYRQKHPSVSVRLTNDLKQDLDGYRGDLSYAQAIKKLISEKADFIKEQARINALRKESFNLGYKQAMLIEHFTTPCNICGKPLRFSSKDSNWQTDVKPTLEATLEKWVHTACESKRRQQIPS